MAFSFGAYEPRQKVLIGDHEGLVHVPDVYVLLLLVNSARRSSLHDATAHQRKTWRLWTDSWVVREAILTIRATDLSTGRFWKAKRLDGRNQGKPAIEVFCFSSGCFSRESFTRGVAGLQTGDSFPVQGSSRALVG